MPELSTVLWFALASLALTATPGPDMMLIAARSAVQGRAAGLATYLGVAAGSFCHAIAAAVGLSQLFLAVPFAYDLVRYVGAAYLLFLAWQAFTSGRAGRPSNGKAGHRTTFATFRQGLLTNVLNPKMAMFFLALFPQFIDPEVGPVAVQILVLAVVLNAVGLLVNGIVIIVASGAVSFAAASPRYERIAHYFLGTVFAGLAARLALDEQR